MSSSLKFSDNSQTIISTIKSIDNINKNLSKFIDSSEIPTTYCQTNNILDNTINNLQQDFETDNFALSVLPRRKQAKPQRRLETLAYKFNNTNIKEKKNLEDKKFQLINKESSTKIHSYKDSFQNLKRMRSSPISVEERFRNQFKQSFENINSLNSKCVSMSNDEEEQQENNLLENNNCEASDTKMFLTIKPSSSIQTHKESETLSTNNKLNNTHTKNLLKFNNINLAQNLSLLNSSLFDKSQESSKFYAHTKQKQNQNIQNAIYDDFVNKNKNNSRSDGESNDNFTPLSSLASSSEPSTSFLNIGFNSKNVLNFKNLLNLFDKNNDKNNFHLFVECDLCKKNFASLNLLRKHKCVKIDIKNDEAITRCFSAFPSFITNSNLSEDERENNCYSLPSSLAIPNFHLRCITESNLIEENNEEKLKNDSITKKTTKLATENFRFAVNQNSKHFLSDLNFLKAAKTKEETNITNSLNLIQSKKNLKHYSEQQKILNKIDDEYMKLNNKYNKMTEKQCKRKRSISPLSSNLLNMPLNSEKNLSNYSNNFMSSLSFDSVAAAALQHQILLNSKTSTPLLMQQNPNEFFGISPTSNDNKFFQNSGEKQVQTSTHHLMNTLMLAASGNCSDDDWESMMEISNTDETEKIRALVGDQAMPVTDPNQCVLCRRVLSCKSALQMHYRTHTGERPFKCKLCQRAFTTKGNLKTHMSVHKTKPSFRSTSFVSNEFDNSPNTIINQNQCSICQKRFDSLQMLQQHLIQQHTNNLIYNSNNNNRNGIFSTNESGNLLLNDTSSSAASLIPTNFLLKKTNNFAISNNNKLEQINKTNCSLSTSSSASLSPASSVKQLSSSDDKILTNKLKSCSDSIQTSSLQKSNQFLMSSLCEESKIVKNKCEILPDSKTAIMDLESLKTLITSSPNSDRQDQISLQQLLLAATTNATDENKKTENINLLNNSNSTISMFQQALSSSLSVNQVLPLSASFMPSNSFFSNNSLTTLPLFINSNQQETSITDSLSNKNIIVTTQSLLSPINSVQNLSASSTNTTESSIKNTSGKLSPTNISLNFENCQFDSEENDNTEPDNIEPKLFNVTKTSKQTNINNYDNFNFEQKQCLKNDNFNKSFSISEKNETSEICTILPNSLDAIEKMLAETESDLPPKPMLPLSKHQCQFCRKHFSSSSALQIHIRTHTGERPFKCAACSRTFTTRGNLKVHMSTHDFHQNPSRRGRRIFDCNSSGSIRGNSILNDTDTSLLNRQKQAFVAAMAASANGNTISSFLPSINNEATTSMLSNNLLSPFMTAALSAVAATNNGSNTIDLVLNNTDKTANVANTAAARMQLDTAALWMLQNTCPICQTSFQNTQELKRHFETHIATIIETTLNNVDNASQLANNNDDIDIESNINKNKNNLDIENDNDNNSTSSFIKNNQDLLRIASKNLNSKPKVLV